MNDLPKRSTEGERSLITHFVRSLSMPHELLMSMRNFLNTGRGKWEVGLGKQILSLACPKGKLEFKFLSSPGNTQ